MLVNMVFSIPDLNFEKGWDHMETFSGDMEVTKHEWLDRGLKRVEVSKKCSQMVRFESKKNI